MSMKVFDLQCPLGHVFEGWFRSARTFDEQSGQGLLSCPVCGSGEIKRKVSASRLNVSRSAPSARDVDSRRTEEGAVQSASRPDEAALAQLNQMQAQWLHHMREVVRKSENVGPRFARQALEMHRGETEERAIRGTVTEQERQELADEGVDILPVPDFLDDDQRH
ncbi:MAG TPA: DUF1178 family protein [Burkholderiaceae bacterium]|nr:DUF1178 family protein [Burkholderiaceae bacterium]